MIDRWVDDRKNKIIYTKNIKRQKSSIGNTIKDNI